jgi:hypothetical protein
LYRDAVECPIFAPCDLTNTKHPQQRNTVYLGPPQPPAKKRPRLGKSRPRRWMSSGRPWAGATLKAYSRLQFPTRGVGDDSDRAERRRPGVSHLSHRDGVDDWDKRDVWDTWDGWDRHSVRTISVCPRHLETAKHPQQRNSGRRNNARRRSIGAAEAPLRGMVASLMFHHSLVGITPGWRPD